MAMILIALPVLFLAGWEGGWWLIPAALAEFAIEFASADAPTTTAT